MVSVGSLPVNGKQVFDLDTQAGVMHVLASVRASAIDTGHKSELRDLVFLYSNGGKDQTVRLALEQKISAYGITPLAPKVKEEPKKPEPPQPVIGKYRSAPSFTVHTSSAPTTPVEATVAVAPVVEPVVAPLPEVKEEVVKEVVAPRRVEVRVEPPAPDIPEPAPAPTPAPVVVESAVPVATIANSVDDRQFLDRIREIKASVNEKVGNPVNLVDIDNEVGREYMGAILDAMKKLNSGTSAASAMKRLEDAYAAVLHTLEERGGTKPAPVAYQAPAPVELPVVTQPAPVYQPPEPPAPVVRKEVPLPPPAPVYKEPVVAPVVPTPAEPAPAPTISHHFEPLQSHAAPSEEVDEVLLPVAPKTGKLPIQDASPIEPAPVASAWNVTPVSHTPVAPAPPVAPAAAFTPLSDVKDKPLSINDLPTSESLKSASVAGDPLFTKEVDDGLQQLLSEWTIFKKSGLFGSGPKGAEHPLFKKMAPLSIPLLLAGRFEGATQEIKQSVTDYMNGWRYEQGLIYQQNETFEHYLRRVIRHILDLQQRG